MSSLPDDALARAVHDHLDALDIPAFDPARVAQRTTATAAPPVRSTRRRSLAFGAAAAALAMAIFGASFGRVGAIGETFDDRLNASFHQALRMLGMNALPQGKNLHLVRETSSNDIPLAQLKADANFTLVEPRGIPARYTQTHTAELREGTLRTPNWVYSTRPQHETSDFITIWERKVGSRPQLLKKAKDRRFIMITLNTDGSVKSATKGQAGNGLAESIFAVGNAEIEVVATGSHASEIVARIKTAMTKTN